MRDFIIKGRVYDSEIRQFLVINKHLLRITKIEDELGITGKSIDRWIRGYKPLPEKWIEPLKSCLKTMYIPGTVDVKLMDQVVVLTIDDLIDFKGFYPKNVKIEHCPEEVRNADVIYLNYINPQGQDACQLVFSKYTLNWR